jgi:superfamily I DNA and/or RNA helicase
MLPPIGKLVSAVFYQDLKLEHGRTTPEIDPAVLPPGLELPLSWIETDKFGEAAFERKIEEGSSRINQIEASAIVALLERWCGHEPFRDWLTSQTKHAAGIGIICMYAAQRDLVRRTLMRSSLGHLVGRYIKIGTVDSYQGKENPITVVSLVRNNEDGVREGEVKMIKEGFLTTPNRINVAVSRAMDRLIIVGARTRWRTGGPVGRLSDAFGTLVNDEEAVAVSIEDILGPGRVDMGNKPRKAKKSRNTKGADK